MAAAGEPQHKTNQKTKTKPSESSFWFLHTIAWQLASYVTQLKNGLNTGVHLADLSSYLSVVTLAYELFLQGETIKHKDPKRAAIYMHKSLMDELETLRGLRDANSHLPATQDRSARTPAQLSHAQILRDQEQTVALGILLYCYFCAAEDPAVS